MWVTVPVALRSMSPSMSEMPTAPPGCRSGMPPAGMTPLPPVPIMGVKPMLAKIPRAHSKVAGSNPEKTSGTDSGASD
jgi:hypothetical protein